MSQISNGPKPRLLYVAHVDTMIRMMLPHLDAARARGFHVEIACNFTRHQADMYAHADAVHPLPFRRSPVHPANVTALGRLTRLISERKYTIVHAHTPTGGVLGRLAATRARTRGGANGLPLRVYTAHGFHFHEHGGKLSNALFKNIETVAGQKWSDAVLTINRDDYRIARDSGVVPPDNLFLTPGVGVSVETFDPATVTPDARQTVRDEVGAYKDSVPVITFVGEMIPRKRHADALRAWARVHAKRPDAVLVFAGDGPLMDKLKLQAQELGIAENVRFLGFRRDIVTILAATDVFLFPSAQEGLPCSIQEALSMGVPVVATNVRGNNDLVDEECGRLVTLGDHDNLAARMGELIEAGPEARKTMGQAGREKMVREYRREVCVANWMGIYETLLARRGLTMPSGDSGAIGGQNASPMQAVAAA